MHSTGNLNENILRPLFQLGAIGTFYVKRKLEIERFIFLPNMNYWEENY